MRERNLSNTQSECVMHDRFGTHINQFTMLVDDDDDACSCVGWSLKICSLHHRAALKRSLINLFEKHAHDYFS